MELVTVRELFKNREQYLDQKSNCTGDGSAVFAIPRHLDLSW